MKNVQITNRVIKLVIAKGLKNVKDASYKLGKHDKVRRDLEDDAGGTAFVVIKLFLTNHRTMSC